MGRMKAYDEERAIDAAVNCFWARAYESTSVRDLADAMGISGSSLYNTYGGKRQLFTQALERYVSRSTRERVARIEALYGPKEAIGVFLLEIVNRSASDPECKGCLLASTVLDVGPHDSELDELVTAYLDEIRAFFERSLRAARQRGQIPSSLNVRTMSNHLLGVLLGICVLARTKVDRKNAAVKRELLVGVMSPALELLDGGRKSEAVVKNVSPASAGRITQPSPS